MITQQLQRYSLLILLIFLLTGCAVKFVYNQLDWLIPWYLDDYVSLDPLQEIQFDAQLEAYLSWHRRQQLPVYAEFLEWVAEASKDGLDRDEIEHVQNRTELYTDQLFVRLGPTLVSLFGDLSEAQVDEMFTNFDKENNKYREKYVSKKVIKQRYQRAKDVRKFIERWTGVLDEDQQDIITEWSKQYELMGEEFLNSRQGWQNNLKIILDQRHNKVYFEDALNKLFANRGVGRSKEFEQKLVRNQQRLKTLYLDLDQSLTESQRKRMMDKMKSYAQDFRELSLQ